MFYCYDGSVFVMGHQQDCCENVILEDVDGDLKDLEKSRVVDAYESQNSEQDDDHESKTWTFYRIVTNKTILCLRWFGASNGYYSEEVDFVKLR